MNAKMNSRKSQLIDELVQIFKEENSFVACIDALGDVTPNEWNGQLDAALISLRDELVTSVENTESRLHEGEFVGAVCHCGASSCEHPDLND